MPNDVEVIRSTNDALTIGKGREAHPMHPDGCEKTVENRGYG
jgi:hypothetical protein